MLDTTSQTSRRIQTVFNRLKPYANQANQTGVPFQWQMSVIKSNELNAWAMPSGKMAMYTGMVDRLKLSDDEIAAVIGHEMGHVRNLDIRFMLLIGVLVGGIALLSDMFMRSMWWGGGRRRSRDEGGGGAQAINELRGAQLARDDDIQRRIQRLCDLVADDDPAPGDGQNVRPAETIALQGLGQPGQRREAGTA